SIAVLAYSILAENWILTGCAGLALILLFVLRMIIANKAIKHFDDELSMFLLPFYEYGIIWRNFANKLRYWRADKNDFTSHKL
ncbi:MAG TPA: glycosyl transferase family 2, partial [Prevotella sp.]|nr:glycosyl transferase family 2 [Candidatus Segatella violae]